MLNGNHLQRLANEFGVTPTTILAWLKDFNYPITKTLGGHSRLSEDDFNEIVIFLRSHTSI